MHKTIIFIWCYVGILALELIVVSNPDWHSLRIFSKPLIVGSLLIFFYLHKIEKRTKLLVTSALLCTLLGDLQLMYAGEYEYLFMGGLISFLIANVIYIFQFARNRDKEVNYIIPSLILLLYGACLFWYLMDSLDNLIIPVAIYMTTAWMMILFSYLRKDEMTDNGYIYVLTGSLLLMLSASIVAITRFKSSIPYSPVLVMAIHGIAQFCLVIGIILSDPEHKKLRLQKSRKA